MLVFVCFVIVASAATTVSIAAVASAASVSSANIPVAFSASVASRSHLFSIFFCAPPLFSNSGRHRGPPLERRAGLLVRLRPGQREAEALLLPEHGRAPLGGLLPVKTVNSQKKKRKYIFDFFLKKQVYPGEGEG